MDSEQADKSSALDSDKDAWLEMDDGTCLRVHRWAEPAVKARAALHIVHGMAEHAPRYGRLAKTLGREGIEVWAADQRGHGETARNPRNKPGRGGRPGHCADGDGFSRVVKDVHILNRTIAKKSPGLPLFLLGHSWGSFVVQDYIEQFEGRPLDNAPPVTLAGCILSGTRGPGGGLKIALGAPAMRVLAFFAGERKGLALAKTLADGPYNKPFRPNRTPFDWLSRDEKEVDAFVNDPLCGRLCSAGFYRDMARALKRIHRPFEMKKIRRELPVYIFAGNADPVGDMGESPSALDAAYRHLEIKDLETVLYPDARHEPLNETNREEVEGSLLSWLLRHSG